MVLGDRRFKPCHYFPPGYYMFKPDANVMIVKRFIHALSIGTALQASPGIHPAGICTQ
jgi:hypothetical protein